jgi:hypothetical protein
MVVHFHDDTLPYIVFNIKISIIHYFFTYKYNTDICTHLITTPSVSKYLSSLTFSYKIEHSSN